MELLNDRQRAILNRYMAKAHTGWSAPIRRAVRPLIDLSIEEIRARRRQRAIDDRGI